MKIILDPDVDAFLSKNKKRNPKLIQLVEKQLILFSRNHHHPSLRNHKITGKFKNRWSISINQSIRMVYILHQTDTAYFIAIGTHDQVYRK